MSDVAGSKSGAYKTLPDVWRFSVEAAQSERDLVIAVRDYLATWSPGDLSLLAEDCRPGRITSGEDICDMAFKLSQAHLTFEGSSAERRVFERMMSFFLHAAERFAQLVATHRDPSTQPDG